MGEHFPVEILCAHFVGQAQEGQGDLPFFRLILGAAVPLENRRFVAFLQHDGQGMNLVEASDVVFFYGRPGNICARIILHVAYLKSIYRERYQGLFYSQQQHDP